MNLEEPLRVVDGRLEPLHCPIRSAVHRADREKTIGIVPSTLPDSWEPHVIEHVVVRVSIRLAVVVAGGLVERLEDELLRLVIPILV